MKIRELFVALGVDADTVAAKNFEQGLDNIRGAATRLIRTMTIFTGVAAGAKAGIWKAVRATADMADAAAKGAAQLGITTEAYQELQFAAEDSGASAGDVERALRRLARSADDAAKGGSGSAEMFRRLGVDFRGTNKDLRSADAIFMDVAERIAQTKNETEQLAIAQDIFGRSGQALLPMLKQGRAGIEELRKEVENEVISAESAAQFEELNNQLYRGGRIFQSWRNILSVALLPRLTELVEGFVKWGRANQEIIRSKIENFAKKVTSALDTLIETAKSVDDIVQSFGGWERVLKAIGLALASVGFSKVALQVASLGGAIIKFLPLLTGGLIPALKALAVVFIKPLLIGAAIIAVVVAIGLAVQDLMVFLQGGDSLIGRFLEKFGLADDAKEMIASLGNLLKELGKTILSLVRISLRLWITQWKLMWPIIKPILFAIGALVAATFWVMIKSTQLLTEAWLWAFGKINEGLTWIEENWEHFGDAIKMMASDAVDFWKGVWQGFVDWFLAIIHKLIGKFDEFKEGFLKIPGAQTALSMGGEIFNRVQNAFAPSPGRNPSPRGISNSLSQSNSVNVTVNAETGASPEQIASAASQKIEEANARQLRLARAALAGGEL